MEEIWSRKIDHTEWCHNEFIWRMEQTCGKKNQMMQLQNMIKEQMPGSLISLHVKQIHTMHLSEKIVQCHCMVHVLSVKENLEYKYLYELLITFYDKAAMYLQINSPKPDTSPCSRYKIKSVKEDLYFLEEKDVLYIESQHNHVIWHCTDFEIISNDSLHRLETAISDNFIRIQRGYLVNRTYVNCIRRCEAVLSNGDVLAIPCKKYSTVKRKFDEMRT